MPKTYAKPVEQLIVPQHFYRPKNSRVWSVRLVPPKHIQLAFREKEFRKSTGQSDLKRATPIGLGLIAEKAREWETMARTVEPAKGTPVVLSAKLIEAICAARLYSWMRTDDEDRALGLTEDDLTENDEFCQLSDIAMRAVMRQGPTSSRWAELVTSTLDWTCVMGYEVETLDPLLPKLVREFARVEKEANQRIAQRNQGDDAETPPEPATDKAKLSEVTEPFRTHKSPSVIQKHVNTMVNAWSLFIEFCGDIPFDSVTPSHVFDFMKDRMHSNVKPWSGERARTFGKRTLREIFGLARTTGLMTIANPVDGVEAFPALTKKDALSRTKPRYPFTAKHLNMLLSSAWYDPTEMKRFTGKMRSDLGARYWVPLLGIFHGNRVHEGVQFIASDFSFKDGLYLVSFRKELDEPDSDSQEGNSEIALEATRKTAVIGDDELENLRTFKNDQSMRVVPVHPILIKLGLVEFVAMRSKADGVNALLFPSSLPNPGGKEPKLGRSYEQAFLRFVRDRLEFGHGFGSHSFRHQHEDRVRDTQAVSGVWPAGLGQQYSGRKRTRAIDLEVLRSEGSEAIYGKGYSPATMPQYVQRIDYSDILLPKPFFDWILASKVN